MNNSSEKYFIIGTAGHVDHGKTELIRALTGTDTDRLAEEKSRGISIDLGFASFPLSEQINAGIVDVPGHERFVNNMLAGVGGIDLVLFVVDCGEGVMPQTMEHLRILQLLDIKEGIILLTKSDLHDEEWIEIVADEVRSEFAGTFLADAPILPISSITGAGLPELKERLIDIAATLETKNADGVLRMPVDRSFSIQGFGTVVTGTLISGRVAAGDEIELVPSGMKSRVRDVEVHGSRTGVAYAGQRAALNLVGVERGDAQRGVVVAAPGFFQATERVDVRLTLLQEARFSIKTGQDVNVFLGTGKFRARLIPLNQDLVAAGDSVLAQLHFYQPVTAFRDDRFVIRSCSPATTIGGGIIIDALAKKHKRFRKGVLDMLAGLESGELGFLLGKVQSLQVATLKKLRNETSLNQVQLQESLATLLAQGNVVELADSWLTRENAQLLKSAVLEILTAFHAQNRLLAGTPGATLKSLLNWPLGGKAFTALIDQMVAEQQLCQAGDTIALPGFAPSPTDSEIETISAIDSRYEADGFLVKNRREMMSQIELDGDEKELDNFFGYLVYKQRLVRLNEESWIHSAWFQKGVSLLCQHFAANETLTLAQYRDLLGSGRKLTQALLEYFDAERYTMRNDDLRIARTLPTITEKGEDVVHE